MESIAYKIHEELDASHWWFRGRQDILLAEIGRLPLPKDCRILDLGCGTGQMLAPLSRFGDVVGADSSPEAIAVARKRCDAELFQVELPVLGPLGRKRFDLVTMFDVLEHIDHDVETLVSVRKHLLSRGGRLMVSVPAFDFLWSGHDVVFHHRRRYTRRRLREALEKAGYRVDRITYFNTLLFPPILAFRLLRNVWGGRQGTDFTMPHPLINSALKGVFSSERWWLGCADFPFGVSLMALATPDGVVP